MVSNKMKQGSKFVNPGVLKGFNPQPEPPGKQAGFLNPGSLVGFNPQPEPPGTPGMLAPAVKKG